MEAKRTVVDADSGRGMEEGVARDVTSRGILISWEVEFGLSFFVRNRETCWWRAGVRAPRRGGRPLLNVTSIMRLLRRRSNWNLEAASGFQGRDS